MIISGNPLQSITEYAPFDTLISVCFWPLVRIGTPCLVRSYADGVFLSSIASLTHEAVSFASAGL